MIETEQQPPQRPWPPTPQADAEHAWQTQALPNDPHRLHLACKKLLAWHDAGQQPGECAILLARRAVASFEAESAA